MVRTEGLRYRDIAIISGDLSAYANYMEKIFANYDIPLFMDHKRSILINSFVEYLRSLLAMGEQNFTYESVFRYLRTGLTVLDEKQIDILENYVLAMGTRGYKKWQEKWVRKTTSMTETELSEDRSRQAGQKPRPDLCGGSESKESSQKPQTRKSDQRCRMEIVSQCAEVGLRQARKAAHYDQSRKYDTDLSCVRSCQ